MRGCADDLALIQCEGVGIGSGHARPASDARRLAACLSVLFVASSIFAGWMHPRIVDPTNIGWLLDGEDQGKYAAGLNAYLRARPA